MADDAVLHATSADVADDGSTYVVLRWEAVDDASGYNLYRRGADIVDDARDRWGKPINGATPITPPGTARKLRALVAPESPEWLALAHALAAVEGGGPTSPRPVDPGTVFAAGLSGRQAELVRATSRANLTMGRVAGLAYIDQRVAAELRYVYELRAVLAKGEERVVATRVPVWAGHFVLPDPPSGLLTQAGDRRALVLWNRNPYASTYLVQRASAPGGPFVQVNPKPVAYDMDNGLDGQPLSPPRPGFLDIGAWDGDGLPTSHVAAGVTVFGPDNGLTYWYRVASRDTLDRAGVWSAPVAATPVRTLPPMAPDELQVSSNTLATGLVVTWRKVTRNVENHALPDAAQTNHVYRASTREALEDLSTLATHLVATLVVNPQDVTTPLVSWTDLDPVLIPPYGSTPFFYRVRVTDPFGNVSAPSAVVAGAVPDTRPPGPTTLVAVTGRATSIRVEWQPNSEPDLAGYQIYRGVCDRGFLYVPGIVRTKDKDGKVVSHGESRYHCDMTLVGDVPVGEANLRLAADGVIWFEDFSVPEGSPLCYGYWVRAYDHAGNLYAQPSGCPQEGEYRCGRLREKTPPPVPVMTGLRARNHGVLVEWIGSPVQDLRAFHVYRSDKETGPPTFLACVFTDGSVSLTRWTGLMPSCADVPAVLDPLAARGSYLDGTAEPHQPYWYRVSALDWLGNESSAAQLSDIPASSTFAYSSDLPPTPAVNAPATPPATGCGLDVAWTPAYDHALLAGYVVFRSVVGGSFRQVSGIIPGNAFTDASARRGVDYLYCVQSVDLVGLLSHPSPPVPHRY
ncbi:MAG: hypothetical protein QOE00_942 [Ilumatobacteraceae bacterium]